MVSGKVVHFDSIRGYGFVAPDLGGEDVFIHVNDINFDKQLLTPGTAVEFSVAEGDRGPKATFVELPAVAGNSNGAAVKTEVPDLPDLGGVDSDFCDVLTEKEFVADITEVLLAGVPSASATELLQARRALTDWARKHGWVES